MSKRARAWKTCWSKNTCEQNVTGPLQKTNPRGECVWSMRHWHLVLSKTFGVLWTTVSPRSRPSHVQKKKLFQRSWLASPLPFCAKLCAASRVRVCIPYPHVKGYPQIPPCLQFPPHSNLELQSERLLPVLHKPSLLTSPLSRYEILQLICTEL